MNFKLSRDSLWVRIGRFGLSVCRASEDTINCWNVWQGQALGVKALVLRFP